MRQVHHPRRQRAQVVTEARPSRSDDIAYRQRRYLIMMGIRAVCFVVAVILFVNHAGWLTAIPVAGAIIIPYFAVVMANGGREPTVPRGFRPYEPNLPGMYTRGHEREQQRGRAHEQQDGQQGGQDGQQGPGIPDGNGAPRHNGS